MLYLIEHCPGSINHLGLPYTHAHRGLDYYAIEDIKLSQDILSNMAGERRGKLKDYIL